MGKGNKGTQEPKTLEEALEVITAITERNRELEEKVTEHQDELQEQSELIENLRSEINKKPEAAASVGLPTFTYKREQYKFVAASFHHNLKVVKAVDAVKDTALCGELVEMEAGVIAKIS